MTKQGSMGALMSVSVDHTSQVPIFKQIARQLQVAIISGRLEGNARLPASRTLASELGVSRNTVIRVFEDLTSEGYLTSRIGDGTYVSETLPEEHLLPLKSIELPNKIQSMENALPSRGGKLMHLSRHVENNEVVLSRPFCADLPAVDAFPSEAWGRLLRKNWQQMTPVAMGHVDPSGYGPLKQAIARYLHAARFVRCESKQVVVTSGSQQSLDLVVRMLVDYGDTVWMEDPGYIGARNVFAAAGANVISVPVDSEGISLSAAPSMRTPSLIYVSPSRQYPLGTTMSQKRRDDLIDFANKANAWIVEDDYDSEFRYDGIPLPAMQSQRKAERIIYLGTFSKSLLPSFSLGYLVVPGPIVAPFHTAMSLITRPSSVLEQMTLAEFMSTGQFSAHIRRMRQLYMERQPALLNQIRRLMSDVLEIGPTATGTHVTAFFKDASVDDVRLCAAAGARGISLRPLSIHYHGPGRRAGLILGFASSSVPRIVHAAEQLAILIREFVEQRRNVASYEMDMHDP